MQPNSRRVQIAIQSIADRSTSAIPVANPVSLDDCRVQNWQPGIMALMNPDASQHTQLAWLHGQVGEINDLLWGYICAPEEGRMMEMADALCCHIEMKTTVMVRLLERLCEQTADAQKGRP